ncbi:MAG: succinate dehydrogenase, cytochrome b556 subunit [Bacteroidota bacterium]|jgi:succinate dehydrogenase / fumarate reductase cytochrome b subunit|nr:succinate dehydrogenase, cytochrome b556 subunit [Hyphomicrobiaceae bacterium]
MAQAKPQARLGMQRPISPHLQIYRPLINMVASILHRITGAALYFGTLLLAWWLVAAAAGPEQFALINSFFASPLGLLILVGYTWAFMLHLLGGIRHFIWDTVRGFELSTVNALCWSSLLGSFVLTAFVWLVVLRLKGLL